MSSLNASSFPGALALASDDQLTIGSIDEIQKLHIRSFHLGEKPWRIAHQESSKVFGVLTTKMSVDETFGDETEQSYFKIMDDTTFDGKFTIYVIPIDFNLLLQYLRIRK